MDQCHCNWITMKWEWCIKSLQNLPRICDGFWANFTLELNSRKMLDLASATRQNHAENKSPPPKTCYISTVISNVCTTLWLQWNFQHRTFWKNLDFCLSGIWISNFLNLWSQKLFWSETSLVRNWQVQD